MKIAELDDDWLENAKSNVPYDLERFSLTNDDPGSIDLSVLGKELNKRHRKDELIELMDHLAE